MSVAGRTRRKDISNRQWYSVCRVRRAPVNTADLASLPCISAHNYFSPVPQVTLLAIDRDCDLGYKVARGRKDRLPRQKCLTRESVLMNISC